MAAELRRLQAGLDAIDPQIRARFPESACDKALRALPPTTAYHVVPRALLHCSESIRTHFGQEAVSLYHRAVLCFAINRSLPALTNREAAGSSIGSGGFPHRVILYYYRHFDWILSHLLQHPGPGHNDLDFNNDLFLKDLSLSTLRMFPAGAHLVERLWVSNRFITQNGWADFFRAGYFYFRKMKAENTPFYHVHLDDRWLADFGRPGWTSFFRLTAEMLENHPDIRGVFGSSWFYDPALEKVSPGLLYLRKVPELGGAKLFRMSTSAQDIHFATCTSERRNTLYQQGEYLPVRYLFIWARGDLIRWAKGAQETCPSPGQPLPSGLKSLSLN